MSESDFREDLKRILKSNELSADELRSVASDLETLAAKWEDTEDVL